MSLSTRSRRSETIAGTSAVFPPTRRFRVGAFAQQQFNAGCLLFGYGDVERRSAVTIPGIDIDVRQQFAYMPSVVARNRREELDSRRFRDTWRRLRWSLCCGILICSICRLGCGRLPFDVGLRCRY